MEKLNNQGNSQDVPPLHIVGEAEDSLPKLDPEKLDPERAALVTEVAERKARRYISDLATEYQNRRVPIVLPHIVQNQANKEVRNFLEHEFDNKGIHLSEQEEDDIRDYFYAKFEAKSQERMRDYPKIFLSPEKIAMHDAALVDKKDDPDRSDDQVRALAVIRALLYLRLLVDAAPRHLKRIEALATLYRELYQQIDPETEVLWRDQNTFRD